MKYSTNTILVFQKIIRSAIKNSPLIMFILGIWLVTIKGFGPNWEFVPGNLVDSRFNNYILEHFFRWISGLEKNYWSASFFFPFKNTIAFSDNLLGSAFLYAFFRVIGFDRETSFQFWYLIGFILNYIASSYVLFIVKFKPLAIGFGAFFFTFGLPMMAQELHPQLVYRFCIPLACYSLWNLYSTPKITKLAIILFWLVWQFYLAIYLGIFLTLLLALLGLLMPYLKPSCSICDRLSQWPNRLIKAWKSANSFDRIITISSSLLLWICLLFLIWPYFETSQTYGFQRSWPEVAIILPRIQSFLLADNSLLWGPISKSFVEIPYRWENQLFPGISILILIVMAIGFRFSTEISKIAWLHFLTFILASIITLNIRGFSVYIILWLIPGINSIRAVTRIQLVLMWPLAFFVSWVMNNMIERAQQGQRFFTLVSFLISILLIVESSSYSHLFYSKVEGQNRIKTLIQQITRENLTTIKKPILFLSYKDHFDIYETDAMIASQELNWATINGYSGNFPPGYQFATSCAQIPNHIMAYTNFMNMNRNMQTKFYLDIMKSIVPVGFQDCDPNWWQKPP